MAPHALGELYASGKTAKEWAKAWIKEKELGNCDEAREIIATCAAIDAVFLVDQTEGAINHVSTEKLIRKVFGIINAFKDVKKESDWKASGKNKRKIDYEMWDRIDPSRKDEEHAFINRKVETGVRTEMEREAALLKTKNKLTETKKK